jgi:hypothetical protein
MTPTATIAPVPVRLRALEPTPERLQTMGQMDETALDTSEQRVRALGRANEVRLARAELKRRIGDGDLSAADVIMLCPEGAKSWPMLDMLMSQRRWGSKRCRAFLEANQIGELKPVGALTQRQKVMLADKLAPMKRVELAKV